MKSDKKGSREKAFIIEQTDRDIDRAESKAFFDFIYEM